MPEEIRIVETWCQFNNMILRSWDVAHLSSINSNELAIWKRRHSQLIHWRLLLKLKWTWRITKTMEIHLNDWS